MFSSQLSRFLLSAAHIIERFSDSVFRGVPLMTRVSRRPEVPALIKKEEEKKEDVFICFQWQPLRHRRWAFFEDLWQNSIKWPRLLWNAGRQSSIVPSGYTRISFCSPCQLNAFPSHKRHFPRGGRAIPALWLFHDIMHELCPSKRTEMCSCQDTGAGDMCMQVHLGVHVFLATWTN